MRFSTDATDEHQGLAPDINLIPFIDILLVLVIFLMLTTTYVARDGLRIDLPRAKTSPQTETLKTLTVRIGADGETVLNDVRYQPNSSAALGHDMLALARDNANVRIVIEADAQAPHQAVINVMEAAGLADLSQLHFSTRPTTSP
jgi:biopolymer transport protein ExbD